MQRARRAPVVRVLLVFMFSAALGGWLTRAYGSLSVTLPTLVTAGLMMQAFREDIVGRVRRGPRSCPRPFRRTFRLPLRFSSKKRSGLICSRRPRPCSSTAEALACDPLLDGRSGDCSSATRIKAAPALAAEAHARTDDAPRLRYAPALRRGALGTDTDKVAAV